jgi:hypothetical protein
LYYYYWFLQKVLQLQTNKRLPQTCAAAASVNRTVGLATLRSYLTSLVEMFYTMVTIGTETSVRTLAAALITTNVVFTK